MKKYITYILAIVLITSVSSCYTHRGHPHGHLPPGKAKKVYGDKSAKSHAPGQKKKKVKKSRHHHKQEVYYYPGYRY